MRVFPMAKNSSRTDDTETDVKCESGLLILHKDSPLYADMLELARRGRERKIELFTYEQAWEQETE